MKIIRISTLLEEGEQIKKGREGREGKNVITRRGASTEKGRRAASTMNSVFLIPKQATDGTRKENYKSVLFVITDGKH